jgi:hypothetical protein
VLTALTVLTLLTALTTLTRLALKFVAEILVGEKKRCLQLVKALPVPLCSSGGFDLGMESTFGLPFGRLDWFPNPEIRKVAQRWDEGVNSVNSVITKRPDPDLRIPGMGLEFKIHPIPDQG